MRLQKLIGMSQNSEADQTIKIAVLALAFDL